MNGRRWLSGAVIVACGVALASPAAARGQGGSTGAPAERTGAANQRYQLSLMEGVLEAAVQQGARIVSRQWRTLSSGTLFIEGNARARGIRLDNYGVFFDVAVPSMRQSVAWTWRVLERESATTVVQSLRGLMKNVTDPAQRKELDQAIRMLEFRSGLAGQPSTEPLVVSQGAVPRDARTPPVPGVETAHDPSAAPLEDPNASYTNEVKKALVDAMLDHSHALSLGADEWLTVAAHDDADRTIGMADPYESVTMLFRIRGADLEALRAGRMTRDEARRHGNEQLIGERQIMPGLVR